MKHVVSQADSDSFFRQGKYLIQWILKYRYSQSLGRGNQLGLGPNDFLNIIYDSLPCIFYTHYYMHIYIYMTAQ